jgi:hypothetical protein
MDVLVIGRHVLERPRVPVALIDAEVASLET